MKLHHKIAGALGYQLIKTRNLNDTLDQHLGNVFAQKRINCVIDVGANAGHFAAMIRQVGYRGRLISFEPVESAFARLELASGDDDEWRVYQLALGSRKSNMTINRTEATDFSSFHRPNAFGKKRFPNRMRLTGQEDVQMTTLARMWPELIDGIDGPRVFLKLDTQGFDLEVFRGSEAVLDDVLGLQSEISFKPIYENMPNYLTVLTEFQKFGYQPSGLFLVTRDNKTLAAIEYDCVMVRNGALS